MKSVANVLLIAPSLFFLNLHNLGSKRDTTKEYEINSEDIYSTYRLFQMLFCRISSRFPVKQILERFETYMAGAILLPLIEPQKLSQWT